MIITNLNYLTDLTPTVDIVGAKSVKSSSKTVSWASSSSYAAGQNTSTSTFTQVRVSSTTQVVQGDSLFLLNWNLYI